METSTFRLLLTPSGQQALRAAQELEPREADFLAHFTTLARIFPAELARAALETAILRREAVIKFPQAEYMYFTREALEQASSFDVSTYRAARYRTFERLVDLGCSIGGDTLALAQAAPVIGLDLDPLRLAMASANLQALGLGGRAAFLQADLASSLPFSRTSPAPALFFDPARRHAGRRSFSVRQYHPPLSIINAWLPDFPALGVKISPGVDLAELERYPAEIEFISLGGELKEAALWFGPLKSAWRKATVLPGALSLISENPEDVPVPGLSEPLAYIYEPDPAVLRAGLVGTLGQQIGAAQLDPSIAYLTSDRLTPTPFARAWAVEDWMPFNLKRLRLYLRERGIGQVVVKKRGSPIEPEALIHDLRLKEGEQEKVIFLTQLRGKHIIVIGRVAG